uniref:Uncharacterized protein n=1 Tax=Panagrolaimus superbus TaxID=310955 RepID=A0A914XWM0_9BILA
MTDSQRAKFQAELEAAIEAEKKGHGKGNGGGSPAVNEYRGGGMDGTLPISFKKPISEGRSTNVNQPAYVVVFEILFIVKSAEAMYI